MVGIGQFDNFHGSFQIFIVIISIIITVVVAAADDGIVGILSWCFGGRLWLAKSLVGNGRFQGRGT